MNPTSTQQLLHKALEIARRIVDGEMNPNDGCTELSDISIQIDGGYHLGIFELLSHDQYGHESLGFDAKNTTPEIIQECQNLLSTHSHKTGA